MKVFKDIVIISVLAVFTNSCGELFLDCYEGNGKAGYINIDPGKYTDFDEIVSRGSFDIIVEGDTSKRYIRVEGDENLLDRIVVEERGSTLYIELENDKCISPELGMKIYVGTPAMEYSELEGSGNIIINDLQEDKLETVISGAGNITINNCIVSNTYKASIEGTGNINATGKCTNVEYNIDGSGNIYADNFKSSHCYVNIDGSGYAHVHAYSTLDVKIDGTGTVYYSGTVTEDNITVDIDGYGSVEPKN